MSTMTLVGRIGRDSELKYTAGGDPVCNIAVAYNYGRKGQDGKKPSQWIDASLWGKRAEALQQYLVKGQQVFLVLDDVHIRTYQKQSGGEGFSLSGSVQKLELVGNAPQQQQSQQKPAPQQRPQSPGQRARTEQQPQGGPPPMDFDDDIPFNRITSALSLAI